MIPRATLDFFDKGEMGMCPCGNLTGFRCACGGWHCSACLWQHTSAPGGPRCPQLGGANLAQPKPLTIRCRCMRCGNLMEKDIEDGYLGELCDNCWSKRPWTGTRAWYRWVARYQKNRDDHVLWFVSRVLDGDADPADFGKRVGP